MVIKSKPKWEIPSRSRTCSRGAEPFHDGMLYHAVLTTDSNGGYERRDYCVECWQVEMSSKTLLDGTTHWKATIPHRPNAQSDSKERGARALHLLNEALQANQHAEAFVLAMFLQRLRLMAARQEMACDGIDCILYEVLDTGEMVSIPKVDLSALEVADLQSRIAAKLDSKSNDGDV